MSEQPVPKVTRTDVERIAKRDFPSNSTEILKILDEYGTESWHREKDRVQLSILRLANGNYDKLRQHLKVAKEDYRDVLAASEYPNYGTNIFPDDQSSLEKQKKVINADWKQFKEWFEKK